MLHPYPTIDAYKRFGYFSTNRVKVPWFLEIA
jgi:hypothetical protein